jgi:hypothetical protein
MKELWDITKIIFEKPGEWPTVTTGEKRKYYFAIQRRFAIQFPMQANALQHLKINQAAVIDFWQHFMKQYNGRTPGWMYTKGIKKAKEVKEKKNHGISEELISSYAIRLGIDRKSIVDALEFYPEKMTKEILSFKKMIEL